MTSRLSGGLALAWALFFSTSSALAADVTRPFVWPKAAKAAVSLAYDDALDSQLDNALPVLDRYRLKASFYLQLSNPAVSRRMADWRRAAGNGHELGNHTLFHHCSASAPDRAWVAPHRNLDRISVEQLKDQVLLANTMLYAIDGRTERTFTAPCGDLLAGGVNYLPAIASAFVAIKAGAGSGAALSMDALDPHAVTVLAPVNLSGKQLIDIVKLAGSRGTMVNFTFHGIGGDYLAVSSEAHEELMKFLAEHRDAYWTDTFLNIMQHVKSQRAKPLR